MDVNKVVSAANTIDIDALVKANQRKQGREGSASGGEIRHCCYMTRSDLSVVVVRCYAPDCPR